MLHYDSKTISNNFKQFQTISNNLFSVLLLAILILFGTQGCQKPDASETNTTFPTHYRDADALSVQAFAEVVTDDYEEQGKLVYDHLKFRFASASVEDYIPVVDRPLIFQTMDEYRAQNEEKPFGQVLAEAVSSGQLTNAEKALMESFKAMVSDLEGDNDLTFGEAWYAIRNWEIQTMMNTGIPDDEKELALVVASGVRNLMKYQHETGKIVEDRSEGCFLGRKISCWTEALGQAVIGWIKAAIIKAQTSGGASGAITAILIALIKKSVLKAGGIALVIEMVKIYTLDRCKCDDNAPEIGACANPQGVSLMLGDCNQLVQSLVAWGYSNDGSSIYDWVVENGVFPDNNNSLTITTISPTVRVRQNDPNVPIKIAVKLTCSQIWAPFNLSIPDMVNDPGTLNIIGPVDVSATGGYTERYDFYGSWRISQNALLVYSGCTPHGQVMEQGDDFIKIKWTSTNPPYPTPKVTGIIRNECSNQTLTRNLDVIIH